MTEYLDPFDYIDPENIDEALEIALDDPYSTNFRSNQPDIVSFEPEYQTITHVDADLANRNVSIQYNHQEPEEKYVVIMKCIGLAMVKSYANTPSDSGSKTSVSYHVVTPELGLMYDGEGYFETSNDLPRQAAIKAPELLEMAEKLETPDYGSDLEPVSERSTVPPPARDRLFED